MPSQQPRTILIHAEAPSKPALGAPCNGCGACCLLEPCPVGIWASGRRRGRCRALRWDGPGRMYRCGVLSSPLPHLRLGWLQRCGRPGQRVAAWLAPWLQAWARRMIASGQGCDASLDLHPRD